MLDKLIYFLGYGAIPMTFWGYFILLMILTHITMVSVTIFLHRCQAHRALTLHPILSHFFRAWLWMTTGMQTKQWVAIHRKHHAKSDTQGDPHSPQVYGLRKILFYGADVYRTACKNEEDMKRYGIGTPDDWLERKVYTPHSGKGIRLMLLINFALFGLPGLLLWTLQMAWTPFFAAGVINGLAHYWGYRNFECTDAARNISPWGILIAGEELHNNHHTFGTSAKLSVKWWEFDIGWFYIKLFSWLSLAKVKHLPPQFHENPEKPQVDFDTVKALITNRFRILDNYWHEVLLPVFREEKNKTPALERNLYRKAKKWLLRETCLINEKGKNILESLLNQNTALNTVYHYRLALQEIWNRENNSNCQEERVARLEEWCKQAEQTGIKALENFAHQLKKCSTQPSAA